MNRLSPLSLPGLLWMVPALSLVRIALPPRLSATTVMSSYADAFVFVVPSALLNAAGLTAPKAMLSKVVDLYVVAASAAGASAMAEVRPRIAHRGGTSPRASLRRLELGGLAGDPLVLGRGELKMVM